MAFLLYGANGFTGALIARECAARGIRPVLAGRTEAKIRPLAEELGFEWRIANLDNSTAVQQMLRDMPAVLHCAGPFSATSRPMADACLRTQTHYLDLTGEIATITALEKRHEEARDAGVMLLPGVGFDIVPTDCTAAALQRYLPSATQLKLGILGVGSLSHGTMKTVIENMDFGGLVRKDGALTRVPAGWKTRTIHYGSTAARSCTIPLGDVVTAWHSTGIPDIETYVALPALARFALRSSRLVRPLLGSQLLQNIARKIVGLLPEGPDTEERKHTGSCVWGEVSDGEGRSATALMHTPNVYTLTAIAAIAAVEHVLAGKATPGFQTPSLAFGADFAMKLQGVKFEISAA